MVAEQRLEPRARLERHVVVGVLTRSVLVLVVADEVRKMLDEVAAEADVQHLAPAADGEQGHVAREGPVQESQLGAVPLLEHPVRLRVRIVAVRRRIEVGAAGQHQRVEQVERLLGAFLARRDQHGPAAGALDGPHVVGRNERRLLLPGPEDDGLEVGGYADDRSHALRHVGLHKTRDKEGEDGFAAWRHGAGLRGADD